jgi:hypothetical protein
MRESRIEELCRDPLPPLIRSDDKAHDGADVRCALARDAPDLRLRRRVAPADDAAEPVCDEAGRFGRADELAARRAILFPGPLLVVLNNASMQKHFDQFGLSAYATMSKQCMTTSC